MAGALLLCADQNGQHIGGLWEDVMGGTQRSFKINASKKIPIDTVLFLESVTRLNLTFRSHQYSVMVASADPADYKMLTSVSSYLKWGWCW